MTSSVILRLTIVLLTASAATAGAQVDSALTGQRVRVRVGDAHRQEPLAPAVVELRGRATAASPDSVTLLLSATRTTVTIPTRAMTRLSVSRGIAGPAERGTRGAAWGAIHGAALGLIYLGGPGRDRGNTWEDAVGTGASIGAVVGAVIRLVSPHERWRDVRLR